MIPAQQVIDRALAASRADETIVIVTDTSEASLRWAGNSMTTNGASSSREWTVISIRRDGDKAAFGSVTSTSVDPADIDAVVRASAAAAQSAGPAADAMPLLGGAAPAPDWDTGPGATDIGVFAGAATDLARAFDAADRLYGFAYHQVHSTWLATSSGLRARYVEPTGSIEINGKRGTGASESSAWAGTATTDFADVNTAELVAELSRRLDWAGPQGRAARRALRDHSAAVGGCGPHDLSLLDDGGPQRARRPHRAGGTIRWHADWRAAHRYSAHPEYRPRRPGPRIHPLHRHGVL